MQTSPTLRTYVSSTSTASAAHRDAHHRPIPDKDENKGHSREKDDGTNHAAVDLMGERYLAHCWPWMTRSCDQTSTTWTRSRSSAGARSIVRPMVSTASKTCAVSIGTSTLNRQRIRYPLPKEKKVVRKLSIMNPSLKIKPIMMSTIT